MILNDCVSLTVYPSSKNVVVRKNENITLASKKALLLRAFSRDSFFKNSQISNTIQTWLTVSPLCVGLYDKRFNPLTGVSRVQNRV